MSRLGWLSTALKIEPATLWEAQYEKRLVYSLGVLSSYTTSTGVYHLTRDSAARLCRDGLHPLRHDVLKLTFADKVVYYHLGDPIYPRTTEGHRASLGWLSSGPRAAWVLGVLLTTRAPLGVEP